MSRRWTKRDFSHTFHTGNFRSLGCRSKPLGPDLLQCAAWHLRPKYRHISQYAFSTSLGTATVLHQCLWPVQFCWWPSFFRKTSVRVPGRAICSHCEVAGRFPGRLARDRVHLLWLSKWQLELLHHWFHQCHVAYTFIKRKCDD